MPSLRPVLVASLALALTSGSCGPTAADDDGGTPQQDAAVFDPNTLEAGIDTDPNDPNCHEQTFEPEKVGDPDILILMDKSGSMQDGSPSKYTQTAGAVKSAITTAAGAQVQWGLAFFPSDGSCGVDSAPAVGIGPDSADLIPGILDGTSASGNTPAYKAVEMAIQYYNTLLDERAPYILIATDGMPNCEGETPTIPTYCPDDSACGPEQYCELTGLPPPFPAGICMPKPKDLAINAITLAQQNGIKTYVVGIDIGSGSVDTLNRMAEAGGTARPGDTKYYPVSDQASLEQALATITSQIISCTFALDSAPPAPEYIGVTVGGTAVSRDETRTDGWDVDAASRTITFYGDACVNLQSYPDAVSVTFACTPID